MSRIDCASLFPNHKALSWLAPRLGLALALLADFFFLDAPAPGLALALFLALLAAASVFLNGARANAQQGRLAGMVLLAGLTSLLVAAGALNYGLAVFATALFALSMNERGALRLTTLAPDAAILLGAGPYLLVGDLRRVKRLTRLKQKLFTLAGLLGWVVPIGALFVFGALLANGNPLLERWFDTLLALHVGNGLWGRHVLFWAFILALIWSLIHIRRFRIEPLLPALTSVIVDEGGALLGAAAMTRALILLNGLFALQSATDIAFLWGGLSLPEGMSYAAYAHRGAYPLVLTALLAAAFVLLAMRRDGPAEQSRLIRPLVLVWTSQNILLVISSIFRLKLYVAAYSLTELRIYAFIWMILVAVGLASIVVQIVREKTNAWLLEMNARALAMALFGAALSSFPAWIGSYNLAHCREAGGEGPNFDYPYISSLGRRPCPRWTPSFPWPRGGPDPNFLTIASSWPTRRYGATGAPGTIAHGVLRTIWLKTPTFPPHKIRPQPWRIAFLSSRTTPTFARSSVLH